MNLTGAVWRKSSCSSHGGNGVAVARNLPGIVAVRGSKNPDGPALVVTADEWRAFMSAARTGRFG
jgi:hypothetical protein